ncbi:MAG TPA: hypothetical protein VGD98_07065 [Ktedonobacteraceae bacterium]
MENIANPWGIALTSEKLAEGVFWIETAENGGLLIEIEWGQTFLSENALKIGQPWENLLVYEQEHDMPVVFYEHPELYLWTEEDLTAKLAADSLRISHPEYFNQSPSCAQQTSSLAGSLRR